MHGPPLQPTAPLRRSRSFGARLRRDVVRGLCAVLLLQLFAVQVSVVRGGSMQPSLFDGDRLLVDRVGWSVAGLERFDVVILRNPRDPKVDYVKRVVGLPGDVVALRDGLLKVNGELVHESFHVILDRDTTTTLQVPPGHVFVLGDNRPVSCDSREFGLVPYGLLRGTVRARLWPPERLALL